MPASADRNRKKSGTLSARLTSAAASANPRMAITAPRGISSMSKAATMGRKVSTVRMDLL